VRSLATVGLELADSFLRIHARGLCYRDISFGNVFLDPQTGGVLICDNDNVGIDGKESGILGTPRFMAPEIVRGEALPSTDTDLYSLAVLLFYIFIMHHPLEGAREFEFPCLDANALEQLFGWIATFIFDPNDQSNQPVPGSHDNAIIFWSLYPQFLRDRFTQAFTEGIQDPEHGRVGETMWKKTMVRLRDSVQLCPTCGAENCYDEPPGPAEHVGWRTLDPSTPCWRCSTVLPPPYRLYIDRQFVVLNRDTQLFPHHVERRSYDFGHPLATVNPHPQDPTVWGLRNESSVNWTAFDREGVRHHVTPGRSIRLDDGVRIQFGRVEGRIRR
jgi:serine/threonine protein kinase